jgi:hypothetical protein
VGVTSDAVEPTNVQLQAAVRRERLGHELDREITLDHPPQARYAQAHRGQGILDA